MAFNPSVRRQRDERDEFEERVVRIDRTRKTVKGGRVSSVRVVAAVGDGKGSVGLGVGKAREIPEAIEKAVKRARRDMIRICMDGYTIPHTIQAKVGGAVIMLRPASRGTGVVAGGATRQILEVSGIRDILTKSQASGNVITRAHSCFKALQNLYDPADIAAQREISVEQMLGRTVVDPYAEAEAEAEAEKQAKAEAAAAAEEQEVAQAQTEETPEAPAETPAESAEATEPGSTEPEAASEAAPEPIVTDATTDSLSDLFVGDQPEQES